MYPSHARRALLLRFVAITAITVLIIVAAYYLLKNVSSGAFGILKQCAGPGCSNVITASNALIVQGEQSTINGYNLTSNGIIGYKWLEKVPGANAYTQVQYANNSNYSFIPTANSIPGNYSFMLEAIGSNSQILRSTYANVTLYVAPEIQIYPKNITIDAGQNVSFYISTIGSYPMNITIYGSTNPSERSLLWDFRTKVGDSNESYVFNGKSNGTIVLQAFAFYKTGKTQVSINTTKVYVKVAAAPAINVKQESQIIDSGETENYTISLSGGMGPFNIYMYNVSSGATTEIMQNLSAGNYTYGFRTFASAKGSQQSYEFIGADIGSYVPTKIYTEPLPLLINPRPYISIYPNAGAFDAGQETNITALLVGGTQPFTGKFAIQAGGASISHCSNATTSSGAISISCAAIFDNTLGVYRVMASYTDQAGVLVSNSSAFDITSPPYLVASPAGGQFAKGQAITETVNLIGGVGQLNTSRLSITSPAGGPVQEGDCTTVSSSAATCQIVMPSQSGNYTVSVNYTDAVGYKAEQEILFNVQ
jgi:hypothetical protein